MENPVCFVPVSALIKIPLRPLTPAFQMAGSSGPAPRDIDAKSVQQGRTTEHLLLDGAAIASGLNAGGSLGV